MKIPEIMSGAVISYAMINPSAGFKETAHDWFLEHRVEYTTAIKRGLDLLSNYMGSYHTDIGNIHIRFSTGSGPDGIHLRIDSFGIRFHAIFPQDRIPLIPSIPALADKILNLLLVMNLPNTIFTLNLGLIADGVFVVPKEPMVPDYLYSPIAMGPEKDSSTIDEDDEPRLLKDEAGRAVGIVAGKLAYAAIPPYLLDSMISTLSESQDYNPDVSEAMEVLKNFKEAYNE